MITEFITYIKNLKGYSLNTCKAYEFDLRQFAGWLQANRDDARWSTIQRKDIDEYIIYLRERGAMPATTNRVLSSISSLYHYFMREGLTHENPCRYECRAKMEETIPRTIPMADLYRAYQNNKGVQRIMIGLLATTGMRIQEMLDMQWEDIDFETNAIRVHGKGRRERIVYTTKGVLDNWRPVIQDVVVHGRVFLYQQRKTRAIIYEAIRPYTRVRKISPHIIRHTYATHLAKMGLNVAQISKMLGHRRLDTTQKYIDMAQLEMANNNLPKLTIPTV